MGDGLRVIPYQQGAANMKHGFSLVTATGIGLLAVVGIHAVAQLIVRLEEKKKNGNRSK